MILDSYRRTTTGIKVYINGFTGREDRLTVNSTLEDLVRQGTGRRPMPKYPDKTPYSRIQSSFRTPNAHTTVIQGGQLWSTYKGLLSGCDWNVISNAGARQISSSGNDLDQASLKAMKAFDFRDMDLGTAWKERSKTASLVQGVAETGIDALRAIKRRDGRGLLNALGLDHHGARGRGVVDTYLAYHYGMKPLLQDVKGAVDALTRMKPDDWRIEARGTHTSVSAKTTKFHSGSESSFLASSSYRSSAKAIVSAQPRPQTREQDLMWALGLDNPLGTAWEVTPFSFVVDWLVPVGDWLQALNSFKYYSGWTGCYTSFKKEDITFSGSSHKKSGVGTIATRLLSPGLDTRIQLVRTVQNGLPLLGLPMKDPRSIDHMAKALSLLASGLARAGDLPPMIRY